METETKQIIGYADRISVEPGGSVSFMVSCDAPHYRADIVRLIHGDVRPNGPGRKEQVIQTAVSGVHPGRRQSIRTGSYVIVDNPAALDGLRSLTLVAWIYPTFCRQRRQGLITRWDQSSQCGYGLFISPEGDLTFCAGNGPHTVRSVASGVPLEPFRWYLVAGIADVDAARLRLQHKPLNPWAGPGGSDQVSEKTFDSLCLGRGTAALLMGGCFSGGHVESHYDGKIDAPRIFGQALAPDQIDRIHAGQDGQGQVEPVACWDFSADIGSCHVRDVGGHTLHGRTVNRPSRAVTGHNWSANHHNWKECPGEYGAIGFHRDDLEDAGWQIDLQVKLPNDLRSGVYAARLVTDADEDRIPFFVRPRRGAKRPRILFLASTLTYLAYANGASLSVARQRGAGRLFEPKITSAMDRYVCDHQLRSLYDRHLDGTGVYYASWLRPMTVRPDYCNQYRGYVHGLGADLNLLDWLEVKGFAYDLITDHDLHEGGIDWLDQYSVLVTGSHPEYWTGAMLDALDRYQQSGGRLVYLGGNGCDGVISIDPQRPHVSELRRTDNAGMIWQAPPGEFYLSTTGELGGRWTIRGRSPRRYLGGCCTGVGNDRAMPYRRQEGSFDRRAAFIFAGIGAQELIGEFGSQQGAAGGDEVDRFDRSMGSPPHALLVATASGYSDVYVSIPEDVMYDPTYPSEPSSNAGQAKADSRVRADMVFFELPGGGAVFSTGSITWCGALSHNQYQNNVSRITQNVLERFCDPAPFACPGSEARSQAI